MDEQRSVRVSRKTRRRFVNAIRSVMGRLTSMKAINVTHNEVSVQHLHRLLAGAAKRGITKADGLTPFYNTTLPMRIANTMLMRREGTRLDVEETLHRALVESGLEHEHLELIWRSPVHAYREAREEQ